MNVARITACCGVLLALAGTVSPAAADDALTVIGGSPGSFDEVIDAVAEGAGFFKASI